MKPRRTSSWWLAGLLLAAVLPAAAAGGAASVPAPDGLIHACYVKSGTKAGQLRVTDPPAIPACKQTERPLEWPFRAWHLGGNAGTTPGSDFLGTTDNAALELKVNALRALRLEPNATSPNLVGGAGANNVTAGALGANIGGGGSSSTPNTVTDNYGTVTGGGGNRAGNAGGTVSDRAYAAVAGGLSNTANGFASAVGGGTSNLASGGRATIAGGDSNATSNDYATIGGGIGNTASGPGSTVGGGESNQAGNGSATVGGGIVNKASGLRSTVGGGYSNSASGDRATVGGGDGNTASGLFATVPGGLANLAKGKQSFAAGGNAQANHDGAFVWADSRGFSLASTEVNQLSVRATGVPGGAQPAVRIVTGISGPTGTPTAGVQLFPGANGWSTISDRATKEHFALVDGRLVLERLARIPIQTWNFKSQPASIRHIGPIAQDFYEAFGVGENRRLISTIDADGVALAAIQGLYRLVQAKQAAVRRLQAENAALEARLARLERLVAKAVDAGRRS